MRVRVQQGVLARVDRHLGELLARGAVHVHVALRDHRVEARESSCRTAARSTGVRPPSAPRPPRRATARSPGSRRRTPGWCRPGPATIASAACLSMTAGLAPPTISEALNRGLSPRYSHITEPSMKYGSVNEYAVSTPSISDTFKSGVVQRALRRLRVQPEAGHVRDAADLGLADADDRHLVLERCGSFHGCVPQAGTRWNCGIMAPSPRSSKVTLTRSPMRTESASSPSTLAIMRGPSSRSIRATT